MLTVALKISFDHCAGRRSSNASAFSPDATISSATACASAGVVPRAGPIQVAVSSTYSTCVSSCRVPLMNVTDGQLAPVAVAADDLVGADPVLHGHHDRLGPVTRQARGDRVEVEALAGDDHELRLGQLVGRRGGGERGR